MKLTDGTPRIAWDQAGTSGPPVLLLMGFGMRGLVWQPQIRDLERDHRLVYFDNRGLGESDPSPTPVARMCDLADDAIRVLDAAGHATAHVVGVSMGGMAAQELTLRYPQRVRTLALIATHAGGPRAVMPTLKGLRLFIRANTSPKRDRLQALQELLYPPEFLATVDPAKLGERIRAQVGQPAPPEALLVQFSAVTRHDTRRCLRRIQVPTLVVKPHHDILIRPRNSDYLAREIPGAELLHLRDGGHGAIFQCADEINAALRRHFARG